MATVTIDALIERQQPFAVYRIPGERSPRLLTVEEKNVRLLYDFNELDEERGFVIAPFQVNRSTPIILIQPQPSESPLPMEEDTNIDEEKSVWEEDTVETTVTLEYAACFHTFISALRSGTFDKLVLSRHFTMEKAADFCLSTVFCTACQRYIHSYIYLCYTPQTGIWLGCTPEIILSGEKTEWTTVALAGTQPLQDGRLPLVWNDKNRKEQEYVSSYIRCQLLSLGIKATENTPYSVYAGALSHLRTDFHFSLKDNNRLGTLLKALHPTPAVCGLPKEQACRFIVENEGYDRRYYAGFIGWLDPNGKTDLYVNLRCMQVGKEQLTLYAGGGLLASSEINDEWMETEKKLQTMRRLLTLH